MYKKITFLLFLLLAFSWSCHKCPTTAQLEGTWTEVTSSSDKSKLVFKNQDRLYFYHSSSIDLGYVVLPPPVDTFVYYLDTKHFTMSLNFIRTPTVLLNTYAIGYSRRKKILNISGFFPMVNGNVSVTNYQQ